MPTFCARSSLICNLVPPSKLLLLRCVFATRSSAIGRRMMSIEALLFSVPWSEVKINIFFLHECTRAVPLWTVLYSHRIAQIPYDSDRVACWIRVYRVL